MKTASRIQKNFIMSAPCRCNVSRNAGAYAPRWWGLWCAAAFVVIMSALPGRICAQEVCDSATVWFRQSHSVLDLSLGRNRAELDSLLGFMNRYGSVDSAYTLRQVRVVGGASPEGSVAINERLSHRRAVSIFDYISAREQMPDSVTSFVFLGRDWQGLRELVEFDTRVPYRADVLRLLDGASVSTPLDARESDRLLAQLKALHDGMPYSYLYSNVFPLLRSSKLYVEYVRRVIAPAPIVVPDTVPVAPEVPDTVIEVIEDVAPVALVPACRPFYMGLKTNMLYDALALPSVGAEFYVGKNWSVGASWTYGWWDSDRLHRYWRAYGGDIAVRRWFGRRAQAKPLTGHHVGLYAGVVTYDFEFGGKGRMGGLPHRTLWDRCNYMGGVEYGYSLSVGRRLNIDFSIGIGYMGGEYLEYEPKDGHYVWKDTKKLHWFGPTKAEISLVWLIGCDNFNRSRKGGDL